MARLAGIVVPHAPRHLTQRGNRRRRMAVSGADYALYRDLLGRPLGGAAFLEQVEAMLGRSIAPGKRGPKPKPVDGDRN